MRTASLSDNARLHRTRLSGVPCASMSGLKMWELTQAVKQHHLDVTRSGVGGDVEKRQVFRRAVEAAADAKNRHGWRLSSTGT